ncbi:hypothetical protein [Sinomonas flava]|uniref:DUF3558 domain-containing protein n=1 Tax=Sinomonas flava TaxID=496857 RepID=A0ABN3C4I2_9MICC
MLILFLSACAQGGAGSSSAPGTSASSGTGNPACDLITPEIAAKVDPTLSGSGGGQPGKPPGSPAYLCGYTSKSDKGLNALSVALTSPASADDIEDVKKTSDCYPVTGIGDFACFQWTGWFRGEGSGASANTILHAVRGTETLDLRYLAPPPTIPGSSATGPSPDGTAVARAVAQAAVDAGWGNGTALDVPSAPQVGPPATTDNPVCALVSADKVKQAFGATTDAQLLPGETSCRYTFGKQGTPGPDSIVFSVQLEKGAASSPAFGTLQGEKVSGVGDRAAVTTGTFPRVKSDRPPGDEPITTIDLMVVRGKDAALFTVQVLISPTGPTLDQTKDQLIGLARGIQF